MTPSERAEMKATFRRGQLGVYDGGSPGHFRNSHDVHMLSVCRWSPPHVCLSVVPDRCLALTPEQRRQHCASNERTSVLPMRRRASSDASAVELPLGTHGTKLRRSLAPATRLCSTHRETWKDRNAAGHGMIASDVTGLQHRGGMLHAKAHDPPGGRAARGC